MGRIAGFGVALDGVPRWALALVAGVGALAGAWRLAYEPERQLVTAQEANAALRSDLDEYARHIGEQPEGAPATLMDDARGRLTVQRYADGCLVIVRVLHGVARSKLVPDLAGGPAPQSRRSWRDALVAPLAAAGRCQNPHPGPFRQVAGERQGCWVPVAREWADGCAHVQYFDACRGAWDANVRWTRCVH